mmetsp:Transcript_136131/g.271530  ORF Transcript_136131/g.271530 Transcript_136131/m.271530 type:complete len:273 (-) Transcript_136131:1097-1915(-)
MTVRVSICSPPHIVGSALGQESSQSFEHSPATQSFTSQSVMFAGGETLLSFMIALRTFRTAHMFVKRISSTCDRHLAVSALNSFSNSRYSSSFCDRSWLSKLRSEIVSASCSIMCFFPPPTMLSWSFKFSFSRWYSSELWSICACNSSTRSLYLPHCEAIMSCSSPQCGFSSEHFFHCSPLGSSATGDGVVNNDFIFLFLILLIIVFIVFVIPPVLIVFVVLIVYVFCVFVVPVVVLGCPWCTFRRLTAVSSLWPSASRTADLAAGVIIFSN